MSTDSANSGGTEAAAQEIVREIARIHQDSYGAPASNLQVAITDGFLAVFGEVELTPAEAALARAGMTEAVRTTRESFAEAIRPTYEAIVERATGRRVEGFASRLAFDRDRPWSAEIFLLAPSAHEARRTL